LQFAAEHKFSRADANGQVSPMDHGLYASGICRALDQYAHHALTIDELHDLQDQLCPTLSEPNALETDGNPRQIVGSPGPANMKLAVAQVHALGAAPGTPLEQVPCDGRA
jgi:hypothetical protein